MSYLENKFETIGPSTSEVPKDTGTLSGAIEGGRGNAHQKIEELVSDAVRVDRDKIPTPTDPVVSLPSVGSATILERVRKPRRMPKSMRRGMVKMPGWLSGLLSPLKHYSAITISGVRSFPRRSLQRLGRAANVMTSLNERVGDVVNDAAEKAGIDSTVNPGRTGVAAGVGVTGTISAVVPPVYRALRPIVGLATQNPLANVVGPALAPVAAPVVLAVQQRRHAARKGEASETAFQLFVSQTSQDQLRIQSLQQSIAVQEADLKQIVIFAIGNSDGLINDTTQADAVIYAIEQMKNSPSSVTKDTLYAALAAALNLSRMIVESSVRAVAIVEKAHAVLTAVHSLQVAQKPSAWEQANPGMMDSLPRTLEGQLNQAHTSNVASAEEDIALLRKLRTLDQDGALLPARVPSMQTAEQYAQYCLMHLMTILERASTSPTLTPEAQVAVQHFYPQPGDAPSVVNVKVEQLCQIASEYALGLFDRHQEDRHTALQRSAVTGGIVASAAALAPAFLKAGVAGAIAAGPVGIGVAGLGTLLALGLLKLRRMAANWNKQPSDIQIAPGGTFTIARSLHERDTQHSFSVEEVADIKQPVDGTPTMGVVQRLVTPVSAIENDESIGSFRDCVLDISSIVRSELRGKACVEDPSKRYSEKLSTEAGFNSANELSLYESPHVQEACRYLANNTWKKLQEKRAQSLASIAKKSVMNIGERWIRNIASSKAVWIGGIGGLSATAIGLPVIAKLFMIPLAAGVAWQTIRTLPGGISTGISSAFEFGKSLMKKKQ